MEEDLEQQVEDGGDDDRVDQPPEDVGVHAEDLEQREDVEQRRERVAEGFEYRDVDRRRRDHQNGRPQVQRLARRLVDDRRGANDVQRDGGEAEIHDDADDDRQEGRADEALVILRPDAQRRDEIDRRDDEEHGRQDQLAGDGGLLQHRMSMRQGGAAARPRLRRRTGITGR
ncbi:hypothetical protein SI859A1_00575 [Aurantimonas manganoxydans SI85-9A1]|uniref:Uncharacterized protein n=1 Tax=Aurantimonas manganoxydans (strain ATCC BAA-1229 / DSM 21871 / SI85-9A1) TaxID=287752 RepID=Q1YKR7_AURMS|nr:hypothetical protein SI859A1_00575 [Aurantimonas manganoxydans SI85-9A1]